MLYGHRLNEKEKKKEVINGPQTSNSSFFSNAIGNESRFRPLQFAIKLEMILEADIFAVWLRCHRAAGRRKGTRRRHTAADGSLCLLCVLPENFFAGSCLVRGGCGTRGWRFGMQRGGHTAQPHAVAQGPGHLLPAWGENAHFRSAVGAFPSAGAGLGSASRKGWRSQLLRERRAISLSNRLCH